MVWPVVMQVFSPVLELIRIGRLSDQEKELEILVLTSSLDDHLVRRAIQAGADGHILKASRSSDLIQAVDRITEGMSNLDPAVTQIVMQQTRAHDPLAELTGREREVFDLLACGLNNLEIAETLDITEATVRTHVASVLDKLALRDHTQVIIFALKHGLVTLDDLP
jgi:NarL family two-component system response regulator LiaR